MFECYFCGNRTVIWDSDFDFDDYGKEGEGIVQIFHCEKCGARIMFFIPLDKESDE